MSNRKGGTNSTEQQNNLIAQRKICRHTLRRLLRLLRLLIILGVTMVLLLTIVVLVIMTTFVTSIVVYSFDGLTTFVIKRPQSSNEGLMNS